MSADNGIYIGEFPIYDGFEYRVAECQAIENCDYGTKEEQDLSRVCYFGNAPSFDTEEKALAYASTISQGYYTEYGIVLLEFDRPMLDIGIEEASKKLEALFYEGRDVEIDDA